MQDFKTFLLAVMILCAAALKSGTAAADTTEIIEDAEFHNGFILYEHPTCRIRYVVASADSDEVYIDGKLVAVIYIGKSSLNEIDDFVNSILRDHGLPSYIKLATVHCT